MHIFRLTLPLGLFILLMNSFLLSKQVHAESLCCSYGSCAWYCKCPGSSPECPWYRQERIQKIGDGMLETRSALEALQLNPRSTVSIERLMNVMSGTKCFSDGMAQNLLGNAQSRLKFESVNFRENTPHEHTMAIQARADKEN